MSGSVEAACGLGLADGIVDLVETGTTMRVGGCVGVGVCDVCWVMCVFVLDDVCAVCVMYDVSLDVCG